jgi:hypothetical protein
MTNKDDGAVKNGAAEGYYSQNAPVSCFTSRSRMLGQDWDKAGQDM